MAKDCAEYEGMSTETGQCNVANLHPRKDGTTKRMIELIRDLGPLTASEIADMLGKDRRSIAKMANDQTKDMPWRKQTLRIVSYTSDHEGGRKYPRPQYNVGTGPNARKPKADQNKVKREYRRRLKGKSLNSVWALAA